MANEQVATKSANPANPAKAASRSAIGPVPATAADDIFVIPMNDPFFHGAMRKFQKCTGAAAGPQAESRPLGLLLAGTDPATVPVLQDYLLRCRSVDPKRAQEVEAAIRRFGPKPEK